MGWFDEQIAERHRMDAENMEDAYARLAASVVGSRRAPRFTLDDAAATDSAIEAVMAYYGARPANIPDDITDPMDRVDYAVRPSGVMRRPVRLEGAWWKDATGAYLGALKDGTPVAIIPRAPRGYGYVDPSTHQKVRINARTSAELRAEAICFYRPLPQRELSVRDVATFMGRSLDWSDYALVFMSMFVSTLIGLLPATINKLLFESIIPSGMPSLIQPIAVLLLGMTFSQALFQVTSSVISNRLSTKLQIQMEAATYSRVLLLPASFFKEYAPGDLANRAGSMTQLVNIIAQVVIGTGLSSLFSLVYVAQVFAYAPQLVVPAVIVVLAQVIASTIITLLTMRYSRQQMNANTKLSGLTPALLHGMQKIKLAGAERRAFAHWIRAYADVVDPSFNRPPLLLAGPVLVPLISSVGTVVMYYLAATTHVTVANYMAFNSAFGAVSGAITALAGTATTVATARPLLELVEPIMHAVPEVISSQRQLENVTGNIEVSNLSFRYSEDTPYVLDGISLKIKPGDYLAIVGRTGCGKSTFMRILLGFEKPTKGTVYYSNQDIASIDVRSLRRNIGVVLQDGNLFQGDLFANITVATPRATLDDAWEAAELAGIADDIRKMPMGMQTIAAEGGGGISGGQMQRILIARAVCGKPRVVMLDEATSALDNVTQKHVSDSLARLDCTRIVIAHRLSTIREASRIVMLEGGKIVEDGTYDELVAAGGKFADLVARQQLEGE